MNSVQQILNRVWEQVVGEGSGGPMLKVRPHVEGQPVARANQMPVKLPGMVVTLMPETLFKASGTTVFAPVVGLDAYTIMTKAMYIRDKALAGGGTINIYLQYSPDEGATWDDLLSCIQITTAAPFAGASGTRVAMLNTSAAAAFDGRAITDAALAAASHNNVSWCDRIRVKVVCASFGSSDVVSIGIKAYLQ